MLTVVTRERHEDKGTKIAYALLPTEQKIKNKTSTDDKKHERYKLVQDIHRVVIQLMKSKVIRTVCFVPELLVYPVNHFTQRSKRRKYTKKQCHPLPRKYPDNQKDKNKRSKHNCVTADVYMQQP